MQDRVSSVLFIDDDADVQRAAGMLLPRRGLRHLSAMSPAAAWSVLAAEAVDVILLDLNFSRGATSGEEGLALLRALVAHDPDAVVVVVTGHSGIAIAVSAMRNGAADFVMKPWNNDRLVQTLVQAAALRRQRRAARPAHDGAPQPIIGQSPAIRRVLDVAHRVAATGASVLIAGERGTGKTLLARTIHRLSAEAATPLLALEEAAIDTLSGHAGTVLLEDPGALPASLQARLSRVLDSRPDLRVLTTTRSPAPDFGLSADLLCRLNTVELFVPRLSDRLGDASLLAEHFTRQFSRAYGRPALALSSAAAEAIAAWPWPGHVRELRQAIERAVVLAPGPVLGPADIPFAVPGSEPAGAVAGDLNLARSEKAAVEAALRRHAHNVSHAARDLGLTRAALYRRMARHGL